MTIATLSLLGLLVALYLMLYKVGVIGELTCSIGSCEKVQTSRYAMFLGAPVAGWGLGAYATLFVIATAGTMPRWELSTRISSALALVSGVGFFFSGWLTYLELYVIHAICQWCIISAVLITLIFLASLYDVMDVRRVAAGEV